MKRYHCNLSFLPGQIELDDANGFCQNQRRVIELDQINLTFSFKYNYYFEDEGPNYKIYTRDENVTTIKAPIIKENDQWIAVFKDGVQHAKDLLHKKYYFNSKEIEGKIVLKFQGQNLRVVFAELKPNKMHKREQIIKTGQLFKIEKQ